MKKVTHDQAVLLERMFADREVWTTTEVATALGVLRDSVGTWRARGLLPEPDVPHSYRPLWRAGTIWYWAWRTGRLGVDGQARTVAAGRPPRGGRRTR